MRAVPFILFPSGIDLLDWKFCDLKSLSTLELWAILKLRQDVFVLEQNCLYPDIDGRDIEAFHLFTLFRGSPRAYARVFEPYAGTVSIGRVVVARAYRRSGVGAELMRQALKNINIHWPGCEEVVLSAQAHLQGFYRQAGFEAVSDVYDEDGIPHVKMKRSLV